MNRRESDKRRESDARHRAVLRLTADERVRVEAQRTPAAAKTPTPRIIDAPLPAVDNLSSTLFVLMRSAMPICEKCGKSLGGFGDDDGIDAGVRRQGRDYCSVRCMGRDDRSFARRGVR